LDECGVVTLEGRSVGASFVGAFTSALVTAEILRTVANQHCYEIIDGTLASLEELEAFPNLLREPINLGYTQPILE
jgi:hypothetical protein